MAKHVYHWKHGWIPLTHSAAMEKAKGNKKAAAKMLDAVDSKHLPRDSHITAGHRDGKIIVHDRKSGNMHSMGVDDAKSLHDSGRHITGVKADGSLEHRALAGTSGNPLIKTSVSASEVKAGDDVYLPNGGRIKVASVEPAPHGQVKITATTGRAVTVSPRQAMSRLDGSEHGPQASAPAPSANKLEVGQAVSIRGESNSRVTIADIKDGRARIQNAFETGAKGKWVPLSKLVPYGADTGRETPMGGRPVPGVGSSSPYRRR